MAKYPGFIVCENSYGTSKLQTIINCKEIALVQTEYEMLEGTPDYFDVPQTKYKFCEVYLSSAPKIELNDHENIKNFLESYHEFLSNQHQEDK